MPRWRTSWVRCSAVRSPLRRGTGSRPGREERCAERIALGGLGAGTGASQGCKPCNATPTSVWLRTMRIRRLTSTGPELTAIPPISHAPLEAPPDRLMQAHDAPIRQTYAAIPRALHPPPPPYSAQIFRRPRPGTKGESQALSGPATLRRSTYTAIRLVDAVVPAIVYLTVTAICWRHHSF